MGTRRGIRHLIGGLLLGVSLSAWADGSVQVRWSGERLSVSADGVPLQELLEHVAAKTGVHLDLAGSFPEPVRVGFEEAPLRQGLVEILETAGVSYAIVEYFDPKADAITIALSISRKGPATAQPVPGAANPGMAPYGGARSGQGPATGDTSGNTTLPEQSAPAPAIARPAPGTRTGEKGEAGKSVPAQRMRPQSPGARPSSPAAPGAPGAGQPTSPAAPGSSFGTVTPFSIKPFEEKPPPANPGTNPR